MYKIYDVNLIQRDDWRRFGRWRGVRIRVGTRSPIYQGLHEAALWYL